MTTKPFLRESVTNFCCDILGDVISKIYSSRGVESKSDLSRSLRDLLSFKTLKGAEAGAELLRSAILANKSIVIIGDFDTDGATSTALLLRFFSQISYENINYIIPSRFGTGYGLCEELIDSAIDEHSVDLLITVDNGISSIKEVDYAKSKGIQVLITDHHQVSDDGLPEADVIINPNQPGCEFASKNLSGVGVAFYLLIALRDLLRNEGYFEKKCMPDPNLAEYLDLVALGTVADMVTLDKNNRIMVHQGLLRIRNASCSKGISALLAVGQKNQMQATTSDLNFAVAPRLNAAGRVANMSIGVECLIADSYVKADALAEKLNDLNLERREIESEMQKSANAILEEIDFSGANVPLGLCLFNESWHQGVSGILASRLKDAYKRPVIVFARHIQEDEEYSGELKGSARSTRHVDVRTILAKIDSENEHLITKYGGHKVAAGLSIKEENIDEFKQKFEECVANAITKDDCYEELLTDGELPPEYFTLDFANQIRDAGPWGMGFPEPVFEGEFKIMEQRIVGQRHLKLSLHPKGSYDIISSIQFNVDLDEWLDPSCTDVRLVYRLDISEYKGSSVLQLIVLASEKIYSKQEVGIVDF